MRSFNVVEDKVVDELFSEAGQIIDKVEVMGDKLFLQGPSFNAAIDLRAAWIGKVVGYPFVFQIRIKLPQELLTGIGLQGPNG